jgi:phage shock protein E
MKKIQINRWSLLPLIVFFIWSCSRSGSETVSATQSPQVIAEELKSNPEIVLIDVRTAEELASGIIAGSVNMDFNSPDFQKSLESLDHSKTYYVYCAVGKRSGKAQQMMKEMGFEKVQSMEGGLNAWVAAGLPVAKP